MQEYKVTIQENEVVENGTIYPFKLQDIIFKYFVNDVVIKSLGDIKREKMRIEQNPENKEFYVFIEYIEIMGEELVNDLIKLDERIQVGL